MQKLLFATGNQHKLHEVITKLGNGFSVEGLKDVNYTDELPETHDTLIENAIEKAEYVHQLFKRDCFSEDTGLVIPAINGEPGVYSARYAGAGKNFEDNIDKVLQRLQNISERQAYFHSVIALKLNNDIHIFEGKVHGVILTERMCAGGFGYDSIFMPDGYSVSYACMSTEEKNKFSHRIIALEKMMQFLKQ